MRLSRTASWLSGWTLRWCCCPQPVVRGHRLLILGFSKNQSLKIRLQVPIFLAFWCDVIWQHLEHNQRLLFQTSLSLHGKVILRGTSIWTIFCWALSFRWDCFWLSYKRMKCYFWSSAAWAWFTLCLAARPLSAREHRGRCSLPFSITAEQTRNPSWRKQALNQKWLWLATCKGIKWRK